MTSHESAETLTPLKADREVVFDRGSEYELCIASEWSSSGSPGIEDVDGAARGYDEERVVISDVQTPVTSVGHRRGSK